MPYRYTATATLSDDTVLPITEGRINLDESWSPYVSGLITVPFTETTPLAALDPRAGNRVLVSVTEDYNAIDGITRTHDLTIRSRTIDHAARTIELELASDEAFLFDKLRLGTTPDKSARAHELSVRGICQWALDKIGATLQPGVWDAAMPAAWDQTNLVWNPRAAVDLNGWAMTLGAGYVANITRQTTTAVLEGATAGPHIRLNVSAGGTGTASLRFGDVAPYMSLSEGRLYTLSAYVRHANGTAPLTARAWLGFKNDAGTTIRGETATIAGVQPGFGWTKITVTGVAPVNTSRAAFELGFMSVPAGSVVDAAVVVLAEGAENDRWFDGNRPDEASYVYDWTPTAQDTPSTRVALNPIDPELYSWTPGQSLWDFLRPFLEGSGLRLFCDDQRMWRLINPAEYEAPGSAAINVYAEPGSSNTKDATDTITLDGDEYATGVVVRFRWTDRDGTQRTAYDSAGTDAKVLVFDRDTPPAAGAAASILSSLAQSGNTQNVSAFVQIDAAYPSNVTAVILPDTVRMLGYARSVSIDLASGLVDVGTRDMQPSPI